MNASRILVVAMTAFSLLKGREVQAQSLALTLDGLRTSQIDTAKERALSDLLKLGTKEGFPVCSPDATPQVRRGLIEALVNENELLRADRPNIPVKGFSETETDYYANLIGCVASLQDPLALPGLLGAIETGGGAIDGIIALGDAAVPGLTRVMRSPTEVRRRGAAAITVGRLVSRPRAQPLSEQSMRTIRSTLLASLQDPDYFVRAVSVRSLTVFSDPEIRSAVASLEKSDTATRLEEGRTVYPVRVAAREWLKQDSLKVRKTPQ